MALERLQKILAAAGIASRRHSEELITQGLVMVNGKIVRELGIKADATQDEIKVRGKKIVSNEAFQYWALNKPLGVVSTASDPQKRPTVISLVKSAARLYPVGRLDVDSHGLIFLTNDGDFAERLTHPKFVHEKEYLIRANRVNNKAVLADLLIKRLKIGVALTEGLAKIDRGENVKQISADEIELTLVLHQGWKRQIRRMLERVGWQVVDLQRIRIGGVKLGDLKKGTARPLTAAEIKLFI